MRMRILPHQIRRLTDDKYNELHRVFLGIDVSRRQISPITRGVYYADASDPAGRLLIIENTPARCMYRTGEIFCLYDKRVPLTEARLLHEFIHRAARRRVAFIMTSGIDVNRRRTLLNEVLTEFLTSRIMGDAYSFCVDPRNQYVPFLPIIEELEKKTGIESIVKAYLNGNIRFFARHRRLLGDLW